MKKIISQHTRKKLPHFFIYAKDKEKEQVEPNNNSVVNRLETLIPNKRLHFDKTVFGAFDYNMLMSDSQVEIDSAVIEKYAELQTDNKFNINFEDMEHSNILYIYQENRKKLSELCGDVNKLTDMLVKHLYFVKKSVQKEALWFMFGDVILENLQRNLDSRYGKDYILCEGCAERIPKKNNRQKYCEKCAVEIDKEKNVNVCEMLENV
jgi:hypothetical protein